VASTPRCPARLYRTLKLLAESGVASERKFGDGLSRYEPADDDHDHHDHLICVGCGTITEFEEPRIEKLQEALAARYGFRASTRTATLPAGVRHRSGLLPRGRPGLSRRLPYNYECVNNLCENSGCSEDAQCQFDGLQPDYGCFRTDGPGESEYGLCSEGCDVDDDCETSGWVCIGDSVDGKYCLPEPVDPIPTPSPVMTTTTAAASASVRRTAPAAAAPTTSAPKTATSASNDRLT